MTRILGLDLGTNSIGWALIDDVENKILDAPRWELSINSKLFYIYFSIIFLKLLKKKKVELS